MSSKLTTRKATKQARLETIQRRIARQAKYNPSPITIAYDEKAGK